MGGTHQRQPASVGPKALGAAILAMVGTVIHGVIAWRLTVGSPGFGGILIAGNLIVVATLGPGSLLLLRRRRVGHWLVVAGALVVMVPLVVRMVPLLGDMAVPEPRGSAMQGFAELLFAVLLIPLSGAAITLVLALSTSTRSWIRHGR